MRRSRPQFKPGILLALTALALGSACSAASVDGQRSTSEPSRTPDADTGAGRVAGDYEASITRLVERVAQDQRIRLDAVDAALGANLGPKPVARGRPQEWELHGRLSQDDGFRIELHPAETGLELAISNPVDDGKACYLHASNIRSLLVGKLGYIATELGQGKRPYTLLTQGVPPAPSRIAVAMFARKPGSGADGSPDCVYSLKLTATED